jgi:hypothetical protein
MKINIDANLSEVNIEFKQRFEAPFQVGGKKNEAHQTYVLRRHLIVESVLETKRQKNNEYESNYSAFFSIKPDK